MMMQVHLLPHIFYVCSSLVGISRISQGTFLSLVVWTVFELQVVSSGIICLIRYIILSCISSTHKMVTPRGRICSPTKGTKGQLKGSKT